MLSGVGVTQAEAYSARGGEGGEVVDGAGAEGQEEIQEEGHGEVQETWQRGGHR